MVASFLFGLHPADLAVMLVYLVGILLVGVWTARKVHDIRDFFMPRRFGKPMMIMHAFGTGTHSDQAVGVASKTFTDGLSGIWYQWLYLFGTPFYWLIAPMMRRFRAITTADVYEARYDRSVGILFALVGTAMLMLNIGIMLKSSGAVISASTGGRLSADLAIVAMTVLFVAYGVAGGLAAAIVTDFIQGILTVVFSFLLLPSILAAVGGMAGLHASITDPRMFSLVAPKGIGLFYILVIGFNALVAIVAQPHTMGNCAAGRSEMDGRVGFMGGNLIKRVCTVAWCLTGLAAVAHYAGTGIAPDNVYGTAAAEFLPKILPGMLGIFLACLLASVMSSCDSFMIACSALFTENVYRPLLPGRSLRHYLWVGRIASLAVVVGGVTFAYSVKGVVEALEIFWQVPPMMGMGFWLGLFWRRATPAGAWAAALTGFAIWGLCQQQFFIDFLARLPHPDGLPFLFPKKGRLGVYLPWQMVFYLTGGTLAGIVASLLTRPVAKERLERFYALTRAPVRPGEEVTAPCTLPEGAVVPPERLLFGNSSLRIPIPTWTSIAGFLAGWAFAAGLIFVLYLIARAPS